MCGIIGSIGFRPTRDCWELACAIQAPRGPDSSGEWSGRIGALDVALAHQRLAIIDLSPAGAQPMIHLESGSVIAFNGEIYNHVELRSQLAAEGERFIGHSDTEVLLRALDRWGIDRTLPMLNGMWAFAWGDARGGRVILSRDRCGEKPLYIARAGEGIVFSSDIRAVLALAPQRRALDRRVVKEFLCLNLLSVGAQTMIEGIEQIPAASYFAYDVLPSARLPTKRTFWTCPVAAEPRPLPSLISELQTTFMDSVRIRLRSDVPVGILLSGGLDSSSIAAAAHAVGSGRIEMLSLVSNDPLVDESPHIDAVAKHLGSIVHRIRLPHSPQDLLRHLNEVVACVGAPVSSLSNIAHWLLMREARERGMTVVLSGQGGDELLCGYRKFLGFHLQSLLRTGRLPTAAAVIFAFMRNRTVLRQFDLGHAARYLPRPLRSGRISRLGPLIRDEQIQDAGLRRGESVQERQRRDITDLSVPTLTHTEDRTSMAWSREIRLPFLDHRLIELLVPASPAHKLHDGWTKFPLRAAMADYLPPSVVWRRDKQGFANPEEAWMRTLLRSNFQDRFLRRDALVFEMGILDFPSVSRSWNQFLAGPGSGVWVRDFVQTMSLELWLQSTATKLSS